MADVRVELAPEAELREFLATAVAGFFNNRLGPEMTADAERACPKLTGRLAASLDHSVIGEAGHLPTLVVGSFPDDKGPVPYAAATELGFHGIEHVSAHTRNGHPVRAHDRQGNTPEQPYLRPALYRRRAA